MDGNGSAGADFTKPDYHSRRSALVAFAALQVHAMPPPLAQSSKAKSGKPAEVALCFPRFR